MNDKAQRPVRSSGIPRPSKVPLPTKSTIHHNAAESSRLAPSSSISSISKRATTIQPDHFLADSTFHEGEKDRTGIRGDGSYNVQVSIDSTKAISKHRKPRPSLSDRTVETLAQIPPSPSPGRRRSSFFNTQSPMPSPTRPKSAMSGKDLNMRHDAVPPLPIMYPGPRSQSPTKRPTYQPCNSMQASVTPTQRSSIYTAAPSLPSSHRKPNGLHNINVAAPGRLNSSTLPKGVEQPKQTVGTRTKEAPKARSKTKPKASAPNQMVGSPTASAPKVGTPKGTLGTKPVEKSATPKSSAAFRETIARAKAAHRADSGGGSRHMSQPSMLQDNFRNRQFGSADASVDVEKRIAVARVKGRLNLAALGLKKLPPEVLHMYRSTAMDINDGSWAESVDLTYLSVADNSLEDDLFPEEGASTDEEPEGYVFDSLEVLDLRGNQLHTLPSALRRLQRLTNLNLSRNQLDSLEPSLSILRNLKYMDLSKNNISAIPSQIAELVNLHSLVLSENKLTALPKEVFTLPHLRELNVAKNRITGVLIPSDCAGMTSFRELDASYNALTSLSDSLAPELPNLQALDISENRLKALPDLTGLTSLVTLAVDGNQCTDLPAGLTKLASLQNANFSRNDLRQIDNQIGFMDNLSVFSIANNPVRERKLLSMNTEDLKRALRARCMPNDATEEGSLQGDNSIAEIGRRVDHQVELVRPGGVLDMSSSNLATIEHSMMQNVAEAATVKSAVFRNNRLSMIPQAVQSIGDTLTILDLSNNRMTSDTYLPYNVELPKLKTLSLAANAISTLSALLSMLLAPALSDLNVSRNRLTRLPVMRASFPALSSIEAADNKISELAFESVQGLKCLDVSANEIDYLEPNIGLLAQQGLQSFLVGANTFRVPRRDVVEKGTEAILTWLRGRIPE